MDSTERITQVRALDVARRRRALWLTAAMMLTYFGFILLVAFDKPLLGTLLVPGLSLGMALGVIVIVVAWLLMWVYVRWANHHYDREVTRLRGMR